MDSLAGYKYAVASKIAKKVSQRFVVVVSVVLDNVSKVYQSLTADPENI